MKEALLIIDVQKDYFKNGKMELKNSEEALANIKLVLNKFRESNKDVIFIKHISNREGAGFFLANTDGVNIHTEITPLDSEKVIEKNYPNSFRETELLEYLKTKNIDTLVITGMMTQMCVDSTTRAAKDFDYECIVLGDNCATRDFIFEDNLVKAEDIQKSFLTALSYYYAKVMITKDYIETCL